MQHRWPLEMEVVLACARRDLTPHDVERARRAARAGVAWDVVAQIARAHRLLGHLHLHGGAVGVPPDVARAVSHEMRAQARASLHLSRELIAVVELFDGAGIRVLPLKGPVLADIVYGSVGMRRMGDLDLLVADRDMPAALALLEQRGYSHHVELSALEAEVAGKLSYHVSLAAPGGGFRIELHNSLSPVIGNRRHAMELIEPRLETRTFMRCRVLTMTRDDLVAYLCVHGAKHAWSRLEWLATAAECWRRGDLDWARVEEMAVLLGGSRRVLAARALAAQLLGPDAETAPRVSRRLAWANARVVSRLSNEPQRSLATHPEVNAYGLLTDTGPLLPVRRLARVLSPQIADLRALPLPRAAWPLYYVVRPIRLVMRSLLGRSRRQGMAARPTSGSAKGVSKS